MQPNPLLATTSLSKLSLVYFWLYLYHVNILTCIYSQLFLVNIDSYIVLMQFKTLCIAKLTNDCSYLPSYPPCYHVSDEMDEWVAIAVYVFMTSGEALQACNHAGWYNKILQLCMCTWTLPISQLCTKRSTETSGQHLWGQHAKRMLHYCISDSILVISCYYLYSTFPYPEVQVLNLEWNQPCICTHWIHNLLLAVQEEVWGPHLHRYFLHYQHLGPWCSWHQFAKDEMVGQHNEAIKSSVKVMKSFAKPMRSFVNPVRSFLKLGQGNCVCRYRRTI